MGWRVGFKIGPFRFSAPLSSGRRPQPAPRLTYRQEQIKQIVIAVVVAGTILLCLGIGLYG